MRQKLYGIFKIVDGVYYGYRENSFSMSWSDKTVAWMNKKQIGYYFKEGCIRDDIFVLRITRKDLPIELDWGTWKNTFVNGRPFDGKKELRINIRFKMKNTENQATDQTS